MTLSPLTFEHRSQQILCSYVNATSQIQVARIANIPNWYFERVVFPGQHLLFEAVQEAQLEIHAGKLIGAVLSGKIPCGRLQVTERAAKLPLTAPC